MKKVADLERYLKENCELSVRPLYTTTKYGRLQTGSEIVLVDKVSGKIILREVKSG